MVVKNRQKNKTQYVLVPYVRMYLWYVSHVYVYVYSRVYTSSSRSISLIPVRVYEYAGTGYRAGMHIHSYVRLIFVFARVYRTGRGSSTHKVLCAVLVRI